jgi:hypothetical protein
LAKAIFICCFRGDATKVVPCFKSDRG